MPQDFAAVLLSVVRYAYASGYRRANEDGHADNDELLIARAEWLAADYVEARERTSDHPIALLVEKLTAK